MIKTAKLFINGGSQAVRLPADFRFDGDHVYIRRDERTGDVILSRRRGRCWADFMALRTSLAPLAADTMPSRRQHTESRDPFEGWVG